MCRTSRILFLVAGVLCICTNLSAQNVSNISYYVESTLPNDRAEIYVNGNLVLTHLIGDWSSGDVSAISKKVKIDDFLDYGLINTIRFVSINNRGGTGGTGEYSFAIYERIPVAVYKGNLSDGFIPPDNAPDKPQIKVWSISGGSSNFFPEDVAFDNVFDLTISFIPYSILSDVVVSANEQESVAPKKYELSQNYPNPFNPSTTIKYQVQKQELVQLRIFDVNGKLINTLVNEVQPQGEFEVKWNGTNSNNVRVASGQYFYQLKVGDFVSARKMVLIK